MIHDIDLDHVAVASERAGDAFPRYTGDLAGRWLGGGATVGYSSFQVEYANGVRVEVLEPHLVEQNDFLRRFLDRNGPGPHHITYKVVDILAALAEVEGAGYRPVNVDVSHPYWKEAFIHPKDGPGVLVQLAQSAGGGGDEWRSPVPADLARPRTDEPATLVHVAHAVRRLRRRDVSVFSFEPIPDVFAALAENARGCEDGRWLALPYGLGRRAETATFRYHFRASMFSTAYPDNSPEEARRWRQTALANLSRLPWSCFGREVTGRYAPWERWTS